MYMMVKTFKLTPCSWERYSKVNLQTGLSENFRILQWGLRGVSCMRGPGSIDPYWRHERTFSFFLSSFPPSSTKSSR